MKNTLQDIEQFLMSEDLIFTASGAGSGQCLRYTILEGQR